MSNKRIWIIGGIVGAALAGLGLYYLFKSDKPTEEEKKLIEEEKVKSQLAKDKLFKQRIMDELKRISIKHDKAGGYILESSIREIKTLIAEYSLPELRKLFTQGRESRRKYLDNPEKYVEEYYKLCDEYLEMLNKHEEEVLKELNIAAEYWEKSIKLNSDNVEFFEYVNSFVSHVKLQLKSKVLSKEELLKILEDLNTTIIPNEAKNIDKFRNKLRDATDSFLIFQEWCNDKIFTKFGVEYEDIVDAENKYAREPEIAPIILNIQDQYMKHYANILAGLESESS